MPGSRSTSSSSPTRSSADIPPLYCRGGDQAEPGGGAPLAAREPLHHPSDGPPPSKSRGGLFVHLPERPAIFVERDRIEAVLLLEHPLGEALGVVARQDAHLRLGEDRARIEVRGDEMDRAAGKFVAGDERPAVGVEALVERQQARVDVEDPPVPALDEAVARAAAYSRRARSARPGRRAAPHRAPRRTPRGSMPSWLFDQVLMPSRLARTRPRASGTLDATSTIS